MSCRIWIILFTIMVYGVKSYASDAVDSLKKQLEIADDSLRIEILSQLTKELTTSDPEAALEYALQAEQLAIANSDRILMGKAVNSKGVAYYHLDELDISLEYFFEALSIFDSADYKPGIAKALNNIAWNYKLKQKYPEAIQYFKQGLELVKGTNDSILLQGLLNNLGTIYRNERSYSQAFDMYNESLQINRALHNRQWEAYNLNNIGLIFMDEGKYDKAFEMFQSAKNINRADHYLEEYTLNLLNIGQLYTLSKQFNKAEIYFNSADSILQKYSFARTKLDYLENRMKLNEEKGDFKTALLYQRQFTEHQIKLNQAAWNEKVEELKTKYQLSQQSRKLEEAEQTVKQQKFVIFATVASLVAFLVILGLLFKLYKSKIAHSKRVELLNDQINTKAIDLEKVNQQIKLINDNLERTVQERTFKIRQQNEKLVRFAFMNSHEIRGPLARVLGLVYLLGLEKGAFKTEKVYIELHEATQELDKVVKSASDLLANEEFHDEQEAIIR